MIPAAPRLGGEETQSRCMHNADEFVAVDHIRRLIDVYAATVERLLADRSPTP